MQVRELSQIEKMQHEWKRRIEELKRNATILKSKVLKQKLSPDDDKTIQAHKDMQGLERDYYITNAYIQNQRNMAYKSVTPILEDDENSRYVYRGMVQEPYCATGVIETNLKLSEIVANPEGNLIFEKLISKENTKNVCEAYYKKIGEPFEPVREGMMSFLGKPDFVLGSIFMSENGKFTIKDDVGADIEQILEDERELERRKVLLREKDSVEIEIGDIVVSEQDCWLQQSKNMKYVGINNEALYYEYSPNKHKKISDGRYVYMGSLTLGKGKAINKGAQEPLKFVKSFNMDKVVLCTEGRNLTEYFLEKKLDGLNFELGKTFSVGNVKNKMEEDGIIYLGSLGIDEEGKCIIHKDKMTESVRDVVKGFESEIQPNSDKKIIQFEEK